MNTFTSLTKILTYLMLCCSAVVFGQNLNCGIPSWYDDVAYSDPGGTNKVYSHVEFNGKVYRNNKYIGAKEATPDRHSDWDEIGTCADISKLPLADNCASGVAWNSSTANYNVGDLVTYNNGLYQVKFWVAGTAVPDKYNAYNFLGICVERPSITTTFRGNIVEQQTSLQAIQFNAQVEDHGFSPLTVRFLIKPAANANYTAFRMNYSGGQYVFRWTPATYGVYDFKMDAINSAKLNTEVSGKLTITNASPPQIGTLTPSPNSRFPQPSLSGIDIMFDVAAGGVAIKSVGLRDKTTQTIHPAQIDSGSRYKVHWVPSAYGTHQVEVQVEDINGNTFVSDKVSYRIINPNAQTVSFSDGNLFQLVSYEGIEKIFTFDKTITEVLQRNVYLQGVSFSGNTLSVNSPKIGRSGLKITTSDGGTYYLGLRVDYPDGEVPGLPSHLAIGSVSEDVPDDLRFWEGIDNQNELKNKQVDTRYIYINGGADTGWPIDNPTRVVNYVKNSLRYGLIPTFIYYQIPDKNESYYINDISIKDPVYMTKYFENINLFLDDVKKHIGDELFVVILEPDFLGYIQQNNEPVTRETAVSDSQIATGVGTLKQLVHRINKEFDQRRTQDGFNMLYGWQLNLWAKAGVGGTHGIIRQTDNGDFNTQLGLIRQTAEDIGQFGIDAGILSNNADLVSIDKYGLDAIGGAKPTNTNADPLTTPQDFTWFWNNDHWLNYLAFVEALHQKTQKHIVLWQITVGHINDSQTVSAYTGTTFPKLDNTSTKYEDSATSFFFGDKVKMESTERMNYFSENKHADPKLIIDNAQSTITFGNHFQETTDVGVRLILFGAGVGASTDGVGAPPTDNYFWIQKVQEYYKNGVIALSDADQDGINDFDDQCPNTPSGTQVDKVGCPLPLSTPENLKYDFLLYPIPSKQSLFLEVANNHDRISISIFTSLGQAVYKYVFEVDQVSSPLTIDVAHLIRGTYLLKVKQGDAVKMYRFSKQ